MSTEPDSIWRRPPILVYLLPALHLWVCFYTATSEPTPSWEHMIYIDFPASIFLVALSWRFEQPLLWFGVLGTLWWFALSWAGWRLLRLFTRRQTTGA